MLLAVRILSYGCTWEVWRALKKLELHSAIAAKYNIQSERTFEKLCIYDFLRGDFEAGVLIRENWPELQQIRSHR